jgi:hypothetical protein
LERPCLIQEFGLEESHEACVGGSVQKIGSLIGFEEVGPVLGGCLVFLFVADIAQAGGDEANTEVVVAVFERAAD